MHVPGKDRVLKIIAATVTTLTLGLIMFLSFNQTSFSAPITTWTELEDTPFPVDTASSEVISRNGFIYIIGGKQLTDNQYVASSAVYFTAVEADGALTGWEKTSSLPEERFLHAVAATDEYIYSIGGAGIGEKKRGTRTIYRARFLEDGELSEWQAIGDYPVAAPSFDANIGINLHEAVIVNNYLYVIGGFNPGGITGNEEDLALVQYAPIQANGALGAWEAAPDLPIPLRRFAAVTVGNRIFAVGGYNNAGGASDTIWYADAQADGKLTAWQPAATLPNPTYYHEAVIHDGRMVVLGGLNDANNILNSVTAYVIEADNSLGAEIEETPLRSARMRHSAVTFQRAGDDFIYIIGGYSTPADGPRDRPTNTVYRSAPPAPPTPTPTATPQPGVQLNMDNDPNRWLAPNDSVTYVIEYFNPGVEAVQNVRIDDTIPPEVELLPDSVSDAGSNEPNINDALGLIQWSIGELEGGERGQVSYQAKRRTTVNSADGVLSIRKEGPAQVAAGEDILYTLTITNNLTGDGLPIPNIVITDTIPLYARDVRGPDRIENGVAHWEVGELANSSSTAVQMVVRSDRTLVNSDYGVAAIGSPFRAAGTEVIVTQVGDTGPGPGDGVVIPNNAQAVWTYQGEEKRTFSNWVRNPSSDANYNVYMPVIQR